MMPKKLLLLFFLFPAWCLAQVTTNESPRSFLPENAAFFHVLQPVAIGRPDVAKAMLEDAGAQETSRFAVPAEADISPDELGEWTTLPGGDRVWRCAIQANDALGQLLLFDRFRLPEGAVLHAYSADKKTLMGGYTSASCAASSTFMIGVLPGETAILEYFLPKNAVYAADFHLNRIDYVYRETGIYPISEKENFGKSLACNVNINCIAGANWQTQKRGVARILMVFGNGSAYCSGSLIANTEATGVPYFLTAHHCQILLSNPKFDQWRFDFDYESATCANPATEPQAKSVLGCQRIAFRENTDFLLLKLNPIPNNYNLYFNGWNRDATTAISTSTFIHHPMGDIKKIATDNQTLTILGTEVFWGTGFGTSEPNTHWNNVPDVGIYESGSSGSPLFDAGKRIVGQLHGGGRDNCTISSALFGRFDISWNAGAAPDSRLRDWLDPNNRNKTAQDGYAQPIVPLKISGTVKTADNRLAPNVTIRLGGSMNATTVTDASGKYEFAGLSAGGNYTVTPLSDSMPLNEVSTYDLVLISKHILGLEAMDSPWKMLAADANKSGGITTLDIVELRKLILGIYAHLPSTPSWRFFAANATFPNPNNPFEMGTVLTEQIALNNLVADASNVNFTAVKTGDINQGAITK